MRICFVCDKHPRSTFLVSHAHNRTKRWVYPNVHKMRFVFVDDPKGRVYAEQVCTKCVKTGKIKKIV